MTGIEPALSAWEAEVLPLNYTRVGPVWPVLRLLYRMVGGGAVRVG